MPRLLSSRIQSFLQTSWRKSMLFGGLGATGGVIAGVLGEVGPPVTTMATAYLSTAWQLGSCGGCIGLGLYLASLLFRRAPRPSWKSLGLALVSNCLAGAVAGVVGQFVYNLRPQDDWVKEIVLRSFVWALMCSFLGLLLSRTVPNLGRWRGLVGGCIGGVIGALGCVFVLALLPSGALQARVTGFTLVGLVLGLAIVAVEALLREAALEVIWAPRETTMVTIGHRPISIGGGDDTIFVAGLPASQAQIRLCQGRIECTDTAAQKTTMLRDGSRLKWGRVEMVVHARS